MKEIVTHLRQISGSHCESQSEKFVNCGLHTYYKVVSQLLIINIVQGIISVKIMSFRICLLTYTPRSKRTFIAVIIDRMFNFNYNLQER